MLFLNQYVTGDLGDGPWLRHVWLCVDGKFYWHHRAALIAEVRPEVHPIHPVQSTYGLYIHISEVFEPVSCSLWQSDHCRFFLLLSLH